MKEVESLWLDVRRFSANADELQDWSYTKQAPYITELKNRQSYDFLLNAFGYLLGSGLRGDYHEYGCYSARTFRIVLSEAKKWGFNDMHFWAFDSFSELPDPGSKPTLASWTAGAMAMSREEFMALVDEQGVNVDKTHIVEGYYADTLTEDQQQNLMANHKRIALLNVDCDLKESAELVLNFISPLIQDGTLIYLDDWFCGYGGNLDNGVASAFWSFLERERYKHDLFASVGYWGKAFVVWK